MSVLPRVEQMFSSNIQSAIELQDPVLAREAVTEIDSLLDSTLNPNERVYLLFSKSSCYAILGDFTMAREHLSLALQQQPDDPDTRLAFDFHEGLLCQQEGNYDGAFQKLTSLLLNYPHKLKQPELRYMYEDIQQRRAFLSVTLGQFRSAVPLFNEILCFDLEHNVRSDALASLGRCYLEAGEWMPAKSFLLEAQTLGLTDDRERQFHFFLGIAYFYTGALAEAKREFKICEERVAEYHLPISDLYDWLSKICEQLGEKAESERYVRLARVV